MQKCKYDSLFTFSSGSLPPHMPFLEFCAKALEIHRTYLCWLPVLSKTSGVWHVFRASPRIFGLASHQNW